MCSTVASRLYLSGETTSIENIGGAVLPPGDASNDPGLLSVSMKVPAPADSSGGDSTELTLESLDSCAGAVVRFGSLGSESFMFGSVENDEADERWEWKALVLAADETDGSELADEIAGDSRPTSGDVPYTDGEAVCSKAYLGDGFAPSASIGMPELFELVDEKLKSTGRIGMLTPPGVGRGVGG